MANDLRVVEPTGQAWSVDELGTEVCAPAALRPTVRNVIVIVGADRMAPMAADKLLKTVEEPGADTLFLACCTDRNRLSATVLGRVSNILEVATPPAEDFVAGLCVDSSLTAQVDALIPMVSTDPALLALAVDNNDLLNALVDAVTVKGGDMPADTAAQVAKSVLVAADLIEAPSPAAAKRRICDAVLGAWIVQAVQSCHGRPEAIRAAQRLLERSQEARFMLARGARPALALFTALS